MHGPTSTISLNTIKDACANAGNAKVNISLAPMWHNQTSRSGSWDSACLQRCMCQRRQYPWVQSKMHVPLPAISMRTIENACANVGNFHEYNQRCMCQCRQIPWKQSKMHVPTPAWPHVTPWSPFWLRDALEFSGFHFDTNANLFPPFSAMDVDGYSILTIAFKWIQLWLLKYSM